MIIESKRGNEEGRKEEKRILDDLKSLEGSSTALLHLRNYVVGRLNFSGAQASCIV